jgi:DNA invertase Pin-like site-specific DNA recombinase
MEVFMNISYERVSTIKQDVKRQELSFSNYKIDKKYIDRASGKSVVDRPQLSKLMNEVKSGDNIYIESISRLGRNVDDLRKLTEYFREKEVTIHFLKEGFNTNGNMYKFLLTILGAVAEMEREITVLRIKEGMEKAKKYGTKSGISIGRPIRKLPKEFEKYYIKWNKKEIKAVEFAKLINVSRTTLYRYIKDYETSLK